MSFNLSETLQEGLLRECHCLVVIYGCTITSLRSEVSPSFSLNLLHLEERTTGHISLFSP